MEDAPHTTGPKPSKPVDPIDRRTPSPDQTAWLLVQKSDERPKRQQTFVDKLVDLCPTVGIAMTCTREFGRIVRERRGGVALEGWITRFTDQSMPADLASFAQGLSRDAEAVKAAVTLPWSQGVVEGHVNRLKLIKRQMYGRGGFELLRRRVLCPRG